MTQTTIGEHEQKKITTMANLKKMCEKDREKVKGIFRFYECPGGTLNFAFRAYKWDPVQKYMLLDGESYDIPLGVAKHLNKNGWYPEHHYLLDEGGTPHIRINQKKRRFGFQSMEFIDSDEIGEARETEVVTAVPIPKVFTTEASHKKKNA